MAPTECFKMTHRFLGNSGLLVSKFALGSWMGYNDKFTVDAWYEMVKTAFQHGVNFYDTAEIYGNGHAEELLGGAINTGIAKGVWSREDLVVSTKIFCGSKGFTGVGLNDQGNSRKHIVEEPYTPIEETVRAMNFVIEQGWAFYWGTSEWLASDIREACEIADRLGLICPIVEQSQYNIFERNKVKFKLTELYKKYKLGLTTCSPLDNRTLTGKYSSGVPNDSRFNMDEFKAFGIPDSFPLRVKIADQLKPIAKELGCSLSQLALAWAVSNENVSTVLAGASLPSQLDENLQALTFVDKITAK